MKIKDLIEELSAFDSNLDIGVIAEYTSHGCGDGYCYCSPEKHEFSEFTINQEEKFNRKTGVQELKRVWIRVSE